MDLILSESFQLNFLRKENIKVPTCLNCGVTWSWFDSVKKLSSLKKTMHCKYCGETFYQSTSSRKTISMIVLFPLLTIPISVLFNFTLITVLVLEVILILTVLSIIPLFLKITEKEEPLW